jgi:hypothetical protein
VPEHGNLADPERLELGFVDSGEIADQDSTNQRGVPSRRAALVQCEASP